MEDLRRYLLSVIFASLICGLLPQILREGSAKALLKTVCGLALTGTILSPLKTFRMELPELLPSVQEEAAFAVSQGEAAAETALAQVIKSRCEAYIQDKGTALGASLRAEFQLTREPPYVPESVTISGQVSEAARSELQQLLTAEFSIPKEAQRWMP